MTGRKPGAVMSPARAAKDDDDPIAIGVCTDPLDFLAERGVPLEPWVAKDAEPTGARPSEALDAASNPLGTSLNLRARTAAAGVLAGVVAAVFPHNPPDAVAGFGAPSMVVDSPPLAAQDQLERILGMDRVAAVRRVNIMRTSDFDLLLQELNELILLDEKQLEADEAKLALQAATTLADNLKEAQDTSASSNIGKQRTRLLERRRLEAEFQKKLLQRKVDEARLGEQPQWVVYGAALAASCLSTAAMHPVDTVKVRKQALGADKLAATEAAARVTEAVEASAVAVASAAAVAGRLAVEAKVAAAAEESSFDSFEEAPVVVVSSNGESTSASASSTGGAKTASMASTAATRGDTIIRRASSSERDFETLSDSLDEDFELAEMPAPAALGSVALYAAEPDEIFAPLGVPLTPAGILSLYDGLLPNLVKEGPPLAVYLGIYEAIKTALLDTEGWEAHPIVVYLIAGAVGELLGSVLRVPAEAVKSTRQSNASMSIGEAMKANFGTSQGRANTVKAWQVAVIRDVPFGAVQIALFETLKIVLAGQAHPIIDGDSFVGEAVLGAIGGGVGAFISAPADIVVTRIIKQQAMGEELKGEPLGPLEMVQQIYAEGGAGAFFRGSGERVLYWAPAIGIFLTAYCQFRHLFLAPLA